MYKHMWMKLYIICLLPYNKCTLIMTVYLFHQPSEWKSTYFPVDYTLFQIIKKKIKLFLWKSDILKGPLTLSNMIPFNLDLEYLKE